MADKKAEAPNGAAAAAAAAKASSKVRRVRLPAGWEGLSFKQEAGRLLVAEVPKACFSSARFADSGALKPQVEGVAEGDEIAEINGEAPSKVVLRITTEGDAWNSCSRCPDTEQRHKVGSKGKFDSPPCPACDFIRRKKSLGLDVALQMWLRAVKRDIEITLGVRSAADVPSPAAAPAGGKPLLVAAADVSAPMGEKRSVVVIRDSSKESGSIGELRSLDDISNESRRPAKRKAATLAPGGKAKAKAKAKAKMKAWKQQRQTGPDLPRTRLSMERLSGKVTDWKGSYGWIWPSVPMDHPDSGKHGGKLYVHQNDLLHQSKLEAGMVCNFYVFSDVSGLGAEEVCVVRDANGQEYGDYAWEAWENWGSEEGYYWDYGQQDGEYGYEDEEEEDDEDDDEGWEDNGASYIRVQ